jgi:cytochrome c-type biogenesis protein CcmH/NrfF
MKRYNLLIVLLLLAFNVATAQKNSPAADFSDREAKTK